MVERTTTITTYHDPDSPVVYLETTKTQIIPEVFPNLQVAVNKKHRKQKELIGKSALYATAGAAGIFQGFLHWATLNEKKLDPSELVLGVQLCLIGLIFTTCAVRSMRELDLIKKQLDTLQK